MPHILFQAHEIQRLVKVLVGEFGLLEHLVIEFAFKLHDQEQHVIVCAAGKEDPGQRTEILISEGVPRAAGEVTLTCRCKARKACSR